MNWRNTKEEERKVDYMIQGSSDPLRHLCYPEEQLEHAIRRAEDEGKAVSVLQGKKDLGSAQVEQDEKVLPGVRKLPLVQRERDNEKGGGAEMESAKEVHIEALIEDELERIIQEHGLFASDHEAWAVIQEEIEEANEDYVLAASWHKAWWERIRANDTDNLDVVDEIEKYAIEAIKELVQVIACCRKHERGHLNQWVEMLVKRYKDRAIRVGGNHDVD